MASNKKLHINIPTELHNWVKLKSKQDYSTITKYIIDLILHDMKKL